LGMTKRKGDFRQGRFLSISLNFPPAPHATMSSVILKCTQKKIVDKIMLLDNISSEELSVLLDWFDKLRVGIWLGFFYLDKNWAQIKPRFYIRQRMGEHDRLLCIYKARSDRKCLTFVGCDTPSFYFAPCCFTLRINSFYFFNISYLFLFARRMGLPYGSNIYYLPNKEDPENYLMLVEGAEGRERIMTPLLRKPFCIEGTELYQPMFPSQAKHEASREFYNTDYVHKMSMNWENGTGKIFTQDKFTLLEYPYEPAKDWLPPQTYNIDYMNRAIIQQTLEWQIYINNNPVSFDRLPKEEQKYWSRVRKLHNNFNKKEIEKLNNTIFTGR